MQDATISGFHAHVYFDTATRERALALRERVGRTFAGAVAAKLVSIGRFHEKPVGPHPRWSFQIAFAPAAFERVVPWLMLNRDGLTVLLHPETGDALGDHAERALWMGEMLPLDLDALRR
ncbi:MAG: DOPA 4,5-dioxygenase family protein [Alphaproteobacteria bacterium]|nr:DOPA 4,5-dioxygenase family protein [Alphaproteobacteria bacterium]